MKHIFTLLFLSLFFNSNAQIWIDQGAVWHYDWTGAGYGGYDRLEYNEDTLIDGVNCQKIERNRYNFGTDQAGDVISLGESTSLLGMTHVSGDTVFYRADNQFYVLYNFGAQVGDTWIISTVNSNLDTYCNDTSRVEVMDIGTISINSNSYRYITLESTFNSSMVLQGTFVERFGQTSSGGQTLFPTVMGCDLNVAYDFDYYNFRCFEDNSFSLYNPNGGSCGYVVGIDNNLDEESVKLYPNPVQNELTIKNSNSQTVIIVNVLGDEVGRYSIKSNQQIIDVSNLHKGIYFMKFENGSSLKLIKE